ncbi:MAG: RIP metalloprotease RseP [Candidatus Cryptobacteroides sp.]
MTVLLKTLQVILALSVLIIIHEFGHFIYSKIFRIRVDKFFLFFDIGGFKLFSTKQGWFTRIFPSAKNWETEYGIGWLPLGGYCKISGMVDESMDLESLKDEPKPWEFRTKPAWQRLLVMAGGVLNNFLFAILAYICIVAIWGTSYISNQDSCIYVNELAEDLGFRTGDRILMMDDYCPEDFGMLQADLARRNVRKVTVLRDGDTLDLFMDQSRIGEILNSPGMFDLAVPFIIDSVSRYSVNRDCGLAHGDRIIAIDSTSTPYVQISKPLLAQAAGRSVHVSVLRGRDTLGMDMQVDTSGRLGVYMLLPGAVSKEYSVLEAIPEGFKLTFSTIGGYLRDLKLVATPKTEAYKSVGSFIAIGKVFPEKWDWFRFLNILALLSIMLGVMNLLPIPGLDGGHIMFTLYEIVTGRKPGEKFLVIAQIIGMAILVLLMMLAFGNDIAGLLK